MVDLNYVIFVEGEVATYFYFPLWRQFLPTAATLLFPTILMINYNVVAFGTK